MPESVLAADERQEIVTSCARFAECAAILDKKLVEQGLSAEQRAAILGAYVRCYWPVQLGMPQVFMGAFERQAEALSKQVELMDRELGDDE